MQKTLIVLFSCIAILLAVLYKDSLRTSLGLSRYGAMAPAAAVSKANHSGRYRNGKAQIAAITDPSIPTGNRSGRYGAGKASIAAIMEPSIPLSNFPIAGSYAPSMEKVANPARVNNYPLPKRIDMGYRSEYRSYHRPGYAKMAVLFAPEYQVGHFLPLVDVRGNCPD